MIALYIGLFPSTTNKDKYSYTLELLPALVALSNVKYSVQGTTTISTRSSHSSHLVMHPPWLGFEHFGSLKTN
jgi:hypothetical protein